MGIFSKIKDFFTCADITRDAVAKSTEAEARLMEMKADDAVQLSDEMLTEAVLLRCSVKAESGGMDSLNASERALYIAADYENDLNAGGPGHYLLNASETCALELGASLRELGAIKHGVFWMEFVKDHNIDLSDLSGFKVETEEDLEALNEKYHLRSFDDMLFEIDPEDTVHYLAPSFIRKNISSFFD